MAISYDTLVGPKGSTGSLLNWIGYTKVDVPTVLDESQALLFQMMRVREMRSEATFYMATGQLRTSLPTRFLDPIGSIYDTTNSCDYDQRLQSDVMRARAYDNSLSGTLGANPFTTTLGSALVTVHIPGHGFNQDATLVLPAAPTVNGLALAGAFQVSSILGVDDVQIDTQSDTGATASGTGGGTNVAWSANNPIAGSPTRWGVWNESINFDLAFDRPAVCKLAFFKQPKLLSSTNQTNFITNRYPNLLRVACLAAAAQYMKDDEEYTKTVQALTGLIGSITAQDDLSYRGANFGTDTP